MATTLRYELTYDAPLTDVGEMLMEPAFREAVCIAQGSTRRTVTVTPAGGGMDVVIDQVQAPEGLPSFAARFIGDEVNIVQREHWTDIEHGTVDVAIPGKPGQMAGTITLTESGGTTTETVEMDIKVSIPLVGGKVESLMSDLLTKALKVENRVGREYLTR